MPTVILIVMLVGALMVLGVIWQMLADEWRRPRGGAA
jgi:NADH:ubiquinone oxidoreductase subunit 6 (subunit J)